MSDSATVSEWLIVVRRDKAALYRDLARTFERVSQVAVILDRRGTARRGNGSGEQRQAPLTAAELELWETVGFRLIPPTVLAFQNPALR